VDAEFFDSGRASPANRQPYVLSVGAEMRDYGLLSTAVAALDAQVHVQVSSSWMSGPRDRIGWLPPNVSVSRERLSYLDLRDLYAGASVVVVPLLDTPQAAGITTILEAMAMQVPVIATRSAGLPDCLVSEETGVIVDHTPSALREGIQRLLAEPELGAQLARRAREVILSSLTLDHYAEGVAAAFSRVWNQ